MQRPNPRRGGIISGLLFAGLTVFLLMLVAGVVVTRTVHVRTTDGVSGTDVAIDTPAGRLNIRARDHMDSSISGIPVYPGAYRVKDSGGANIEWRSADGDSDKGLSVVGGEFRTQDPASRVIAFYRQQLPGVLIVSKEDGTTQFEFGEHGLRRIVSIIEKNDETHIGIASIGGRESN